MSPKENEYFAKRVVHYLNSMAKGDAKSIIQHFVKEGRRRTTVSRIIKRYKDTGMTEYTPIPGRPVSKQMLKTQKKIETPFIKCPTTSVRIVAKKLNIPKSTHENPNVPQARGIEKFRALCKQRYSEQKNTPKNIGGFKRIWNKISKNVAEELGKTVLEVWEEGGNRRGKVIDVDPI
ncbi:hypothetical protein ILUMI_14465 [Ignelater luminosus]|uniref:Uncharacterized protein n=1 Tax=Ignelater luminosus TaxID=2038154 RepID=A0A8K0CVX0_IGNLU|nr:hypothetical protein ILUMI_14465 [Ignelater luminosus]